MTKSEKKHWSKYKAKRQKEIEEAFNQVKFYYDWAIDHAKQMGKYEGKAQALLDAAKNLTASKSDDYYELLENPFYKWIDGDEDED